MCNALPSIFVSSYAIYWMFVHVPHSMFVGVLAKIVGGKFLFGGGILCTGLLTIITPPVAHLSVYVLIALRVLEGLCEVCSALFNFMVLQTSIFICTFVRTSEK